MILVPLLLAPIVMAVAAVVEQRLGASAAGWVAALPVAFSVAVVAVTLDAGSGAAARMALSAATHVPAQVLFGVTFAGVLVRRGIAAGAAAGTAAYAAASVVIADLPVALGVAAAILALAVAPRYMHAGRPRPGSPRRRTTTALTCAAATGIVAEAVLISRLAGPEIAGAVAAFPAMCLILTLTVGVRDGRPAGAHALTGLVRSLPCYLTFCLVVAATAPAAGAPAVALGLLGCLAAARVTWRSVPVAALAR